MLVVGLGNAPNGPVVLFALLRFPNGEDDPRVPKALLGPASCGLDEPKMPVLALGAASGVLDEPKSLLPAPGAASCALDEPKSPVPALGAASPVLNDPKRPVPVLGAASGVLDEPKMLVPALEAALGVLDEPKMPVPALGTVFGVSIGSHGPFAKRPGAVEPNALLELPGNGLFTSERSRYLARTVFASNEGVEVALLKSWPVLSFTLMVAENEVGLALLSACRLHV